MFFPIKDSDKWRPLIILFLQQFTNYTSIHGQTRDKMHESSRATWVVTKAQETFSFSL